MNTLEYILNKYNLEPGKRFYEIPNTSRETFAVLLAELGFTCGAEIGVERGVYSDILLRANPALKLISVDAWAQYTGYRDHMTQAQMDVLYEEAKEKLRPYGTRSLVIKGYSTEVAKDVTDESLDFVYLDGNHEFTEVVNDIASWQRKVRPGGIVSGHDYIKSHNMQNLKQVPYAIHAYMDAYRLSPLFILGRKDKLPGELRENTRSWFYVKPTA